MYKINWDIIISWVLAPIICTSTLFEYLQVCVSIVKARYAEFMALRDVVLSEIEWRGCTAEFELMLNEQYDTHGIRIETIHIAETVYIYGDTENAENQIYMFDDSEYSDTTLPVNYVFSDGVMSGVYNFIVHVPLALASKNNAIAATVRRYKAAGMTFAIVNSE